MESVEYFEFRWHLSAIDLDGSIYSVGIDLDLDGIIDHPFTSNDWNNLSYHTIIFTFADTVEYGEGQIELIESDHTAESQCIYRMNLIVIDNEGARLIEPITQRTWYSGWECKQVRDSTVV